MQANAILVGQEYAHTEFPSRNKTYYPYAGRVRVLHVYKVEDPWRKKKQTLVECVALDKTTGERETDSWTGEELPIKTVRAREIVAPWAEHLIEQERHDVKERERRERSERIRKEREEHYRKLEEERRERYAREEEARRKIAEEARQLKEARDKLIYAFFESVGIPRDHIDVHDGSVVIYLEGEVKEVLKQFEQDTRSTTSA